LNCTARLRPEWKASWVSGGTDITTARVSIEHSLGDALATLPEVRKVSHLGEIICHSVLLANNVGDFTTAVALVAVVETV